jgi:hypothetical protein
MVKLKWVCPGLGRALCAVGIKLGTRIILVVKHSVVSVGAAIVATRHSL